METAKYIGKVLPKSYLSIPLKTLNDLGLVEGDEIEVVLKKIKHLQSKKTGQESSLSRYDEKRLSQLLFKNREGEISDAELLELEKLVLESQLKTIEKAKSLYEKKKSTFIHNQKQDKS